VTALCSLKVRTNSSWPTVSWASVRCRTLRKLIHDHNIYFLVFSSELSVLIMTTTVLVQTATLLGKRKLDHFTYNIDSSSSSKIGSSPPDLINGQLKNRFIVHLRVATKLILNHRACKSTSALTLERYVLSGTREPVSCSFILVQKAAVCLHGVWKFLFSR
jgi:hypothetical protein